MSGLNTDLTRLLGCRVPVVQTAMGWVAEPQLVIATTRAGGFGFLAGASIPPGQVEAQIAEVEAGCDGKFGVNFHMFQPNADEIISAILNHAGRIRAVSYGRGPDAATIAKFKAAGILCMPTVGAVKHAVKAVELGADIITMQGGEGGGHTGAVPTSLLLPQVLDAVDVPVVAAGGFHDGRGLAAALAWGAQGIAMGTRFLLTTDSPVARDTLAVYLQTGDPSVIRVTRAVDGLPQRFIANDKLEHLEGMSGPARLMASLRHGFAYGRANGMGVADMLRLAWRSARSDDSSFAATVQAPNLPTLVQRGLVKGDTDAGLLPSGQVAALIDELESCEALISGIEADAIARIASLTALSRDHTQEATHV
ncbi:NAD(P)H-dependent flavin oxidoreductase [Thalassorhabdomicrobium marinisediminis]|uniref:2-nitropropane dioxygenase n=1 Tax=Thalassorhabdomicrobium marinisediminis TaxID=2170577 RepID=A0A2T7FU98_9RHOB|nr:nitronate monooxygenase [Thalassorhabdomicrobium marinisediminis]PVA05736.1 2-nitropropane dioxygenase [Thalassorhabdomicrobium marinisediminis]